MKPSEKPYPRPSFWDAIAITLGAIALVVAALVGLSIKAVNNSFDPERAKSIALSIISYDIPQGSLGVYGVNIGGLKLAEVRSINNYSSTIPDISLVVGRIVLDKQNNSERPPAAEEDLIPFSYYLENNFYPTEQFTEKHRVCDSLVDINVELGTLTWLENNMESSITARRYNTTVTVNQLKYLIKLTTVGDNSRENAHQVLQSLICK